jgi:periplasmic protein TonB
MFDTLIESTKQKRSRRTGRVFAVTCAAYAAALLALGIGTILSFSPVLAESYALLLPVVPPVPGKPEPAPRQSQPQKLAAEPAPRFVPPERPIEIPPAESVQSRPRLTFAATNGPGIPLGLGDPTGIDGMTGDNDSAPPAPPEPRKPAKADPPPPAPEPKPQGLTRVSEGVLAGGAIRKSKPAYPPIAKAARASGAVQVQVTISEEGAVIGAVVLNGHPLLRAAALDAARQWTFSPTRLSNVPVKVQGILTFNFTLE